MTFLLDQLPGVLVGVVIGGAGMLLFVMGVDAWSTRRIK